MTRHNRRLLVLGGGVVWLSAWLLLGLGWGECGLLLTALVVVPLALDSLEAGALLPARSRAFGLLRLLAPPAALALVGAFAVEAGRMGGALAAPWFLVTLLLTRLGAARLLSRRGGPAAEIAIDGALLFQVVGGGWILAHRAGLRPLGFDAGLVLLSAVHMHLAALVLPLLLGLAGRLVPGRVTLCATTSVLSGFPLVAWGLVASHPVEVVGVALLVLGGVLVAVQQMRLAWSPVGAGRPRFRAMLSLSSLALVLAMGLSAAFAVANLLDWGRPHRVDMLRWHGGLNALGFALLGLLAHADSRDGWGSAEGCSPPLQNHALAVEVDPHRPGGDQ